MLDRAEIEEEQLDPKSEDQLEENPVEIHERVEIETEELNRNSGDVEILERVDIDTEELNPNSGDQLQENLEKVFDRVDDKTE